MTHSQIQLIHIFVDHSNMWGGARAASRIRRPKTPDHEARVSIRVLDRLLGGRRQGVSTKVVSGGVPPGMEGVWAEYQKAGYDTQRLFRDKNWKEHGVDHTLIGHMWRLLARHQAAPIILVLASGDGSNNEFGTSFREVISEVLTHDRFASWHVELASFDPPYPNAAGVRSPTNQRMKALVENSPRGRFINLYDNYDTVVYHEP